MTKDVKRILMEFLTNDNLELYNRTKQPNYNMCTITKTLSLEIISTIETTGMELQL